MCKNCKSKNSGIANDVATGIHGLHTAADNLLWPLKPVDDVIHGVAQGAFNWLTDKHPGQDASSDSDSDGPPPPRRRSQSSCSYGNEYPGYKSHSYGGVYRNRKRDVFTGNRGSEIGTVTGGGGRVKDCAKFTVN